jgi:hypothetical protein
MKGIFLLKVKTWAGQSKNNQLPNNNNLQESNSLIKKVPSYKLPTAKRPSKHSRSNEIDPEI